LFFELLTSFEAIRQTLPVVQHHAEFVHWLLTSFACAVVCALAAFAMIQAILLLPFHLMLAVLNRTTWELLKSGTVQYLKDWHYSFSPFSRGMLINIYEFLHMRWDHPLYGIPKGSQIEQWKRENHCLVNETYECC
jgi:hypothetical protein